MHPVNFLIVQGFFFRERVIGRGTYIKLLDFQICLK